MITPTPMNLYEAATNLPRVRTSMFHSGETKDYSFELGYRDGGYYILAIPYEYLCPSPQTGPFHSTSTTAFFCTGDKIENQVPTKELRLMTDGNRWEWD